MTTETLSTLARSIALLLTCLNMFAAGAAAFLYFKGDNQAKATDSKPGDGNGLKTAATVILVCVFVLNMFGFLGYGVSFALPSSTAAEPTQTAPAPDGQQPDSNAPKHDFPTPGEIQVSGNTINAGFAYIRVDVTCFNEACTEGDVYINFTDNLPTNMPIGDAYDGNPLHRRYAFTSTTGKPWVSIYQDGCHFAENVRLGYYGSTDFNVYYPNGDGGYLPINQVPNCDKVPNYIFP